MTRVREGATAIVRLAAATQENFIDDAGSCGTLTSFLSGPGTNRGFARLTFEPAKLSPAYLNFDSLKPTVSVFAVRVQPMSWYTPVTALIFSASYDKEVSTGDFQIGRHSGQPAINFGFPVLNDHGDLHRVLFAP